MKRIVWRFVFDDLRCVESDLREGDFIDPEHCSIEDEDYRIEEQIRDDNWSIVTINQGRMQENIQVFVNKAVVKFYAKQVHENYQEEGPKIDPSYHVDQSVFATE